MVYCFCDICDYKDECKYYRKVVVCPYIKTEEQLWQQVRPPNQKGDKFNKISSYGQNKIT